MEGEGIEGVEGKVGEGRGGEGDGEEWGDGRIWYGREKEYETRGDGMVGEKRR